MRNFKAILSVILHSVSLLSVFLLSSCSPLYIIRAAYEEGRILWRREPIESALRQPDLDPGQRDKFQLVLQVREYARDRLKMKVGGSYASYSFVDGPVLTYLLMAAPKTSLAPYTWWFLFVGRVPYKGFFPQDDARAEAQALEAQGYDTYIRTSPAFSTLGWFNDPLLAHLLKYDRVTLAQVVFHELFHNTLYVSGAGDFNESMANFVGNRGAIDFFRDRYGEGSPEHQKAVQTWEEELEFSAFIAEVARSLKDLYGQNLPEEETLRLREEIFFRSQNEWSRRTADRQTHRFRGYAQQKINNAVIMHYLLYLKGLQLFENLYQAEGRELPRVMELVEKSVQNSGDPFDAVGELLKRG